MTQHVVIVNHAPVPVFAYGGTERVIWDLARALVEAGHRVTFLVPAPSHCDFAIVRILDKNKSLAEQIPENADIVHLNFQPDEYWQNAQIPYLVSEHGNSAPGKVLDKNTIFVSKNHAARHGSDAFVYNGLNWADYGDVNFSKKPQGYFHFLGKAAWRVKNVEGAIAVARAAGVRLEVLGGKRFNFSRGIRLTFWPGIGFHGMVGGAVKMQLLRASRGLIFPVRWHEPFGLAIIESMYFGCPVFATPYGAIPELVPEWAGCLSVDKNILVDALNQDFDRLRIHQWVVEKFNYRRMMQDYLLYYQKVQSGKSINSNTIKAQDEFSHLPWNE